MDSKNSESDDNLMFVGESQIPRLEVVDRLRGVAVLAVCLSHFMSANNGIGRDTWVWSAGTHGWLGVDIFFVISGFIIPFALHRARFAWADYPRFLLRRVIRLDPPYFAGIVIAILTGVWAASMPFYRGELLQVTAPQVLLHFAFLNTFFDYDWVNPVFWSLAIEFQYYLLVGLLYPWIAHRAAPVRLALLMVLAALAFGFPAERYVCHWLFLFLLGIAAFQWRAGLWSPSMLVPVLGVSTVGASLTHGTLVAGVSLAASLIIMFGRLPERVLLFYGTISYSLYLLHGPVGLKVVNFCGRYVSTTAGGLVAISAGFVVSTFCAWLLFRFVEQPAQRWAAAIRYKKAEGVAHP